MRKRDLNKQARDIFNEHIKTLAPGETAHCNHDGCPAGEDTRSRLYFTRKSNPVELVVYFCHNCTEGGAFSTSGRAKLEPRSTAAKGNELQHIMDVMGRSVDVTKLAGSPLTIEQTCWITAGQPMCHWSYYPEDFILFDPMDRSLVFPIWTTNPEQGDSPWPLAIQKRYHREYGPKCITTKANDAVTVRTFVRPAVKHPANPVVVVEDMLSAYRVVKDAGHVAYVLFGNHMDMSELVEHRDEFSNGVTVWLDNDNDQVLENALKIHKRAQMLGLPTNLIQGVLEPKKLTPPALRYMLGVAP